uniref:Uncharacterized protein n=1 Tax=Arundo donax TaxID=35708 RepID=A0A0A9B0X9_ARUDO
MESSPVVTPPEIEASQHQLDEFPSGCPSARTPPVEVVMPMLSSPTIVKWNRVSIANARRTDWAKRARCVVGSPATRLINQMAISPSTVLRSPRCAITQNSHEHMW